MLRASLWSSTSDVVAATIAAGRTAILTQLSLFPNRLPSFLHAVALLSPPPRPLWNLLCLAFTPQGPIVREAQHCDAHFAISVFSGKPYSPHALAAFSSNNPPAHLSAKIFPAAAQSPTPVCLISSSDYSVLPPTKRPPSSTVAPGRLYAQRSIDMLTNARPADLD